MKKTTRRKYRRRFVKIEGETILVERLPAKRGGYYFRAYANLEILSTLLQPPLAVGLDMKEVLAECHRKGVLKRVKSQQDKAMSDGVMLRSTKHPDYLCDPDDWYITNRKPYPRP